MKSWFIESNTQDGLMGSDHCPVYAVMEDEVEVSQEKIALVDIMSPSGYFVDGKRLKEYSTRDIPVFSGKLLPEFDKRRSIRDMFIKKPSLSQSTTLDVTTAEADADTTPAPSIPKEFTPPPPSAPPPADSPFSVASQTSVTTSLASPASKPTAKRTASDAPTGKGSKRAKGNGPSATAASSKGQQSLKGFFKPKTPLTEAAPDSRTPALSARPILQISPQASTNILEASQGSTHNVKETSLSPLKNQVPFFPADSTFPPDLDDDVIDPIVSKESWSKLFSKPAGPRCEHDEPCKTMKTKKPGFNCGREFWMCQRPLGPSGTKEKGTEWRCGTFIWSSDWSGNGNREREP